MPEPGGEPAAEPVQVPLDLPGHLLGPYAPYRQVEVPLRPRGKAVDGGLGEEQGIAYAERWTPCISGEIMDISPQCAHSGMIRPDMLAQVWSGISAWLGLGEAGSG